jgi:4-hydroxy-tetrahydrodipicolinate reductase
LPEKFGEVIFRFMIKVAITGAFGRMGTTAQNCLTAENGFRITALIGRGDSLISAIETEKPDVLLELSTASSAPGFIRTANAAGIPVVVGSTGMNDLIEFEKLAASSPIWFIPNFSIGAVLMMKFAESAARFFADAEIIELHHEKKLDAPSGTAIRTAQLIAENRSSEPTVETTQTLKLQGARGGEYSGIRLHSVRLPGMLAHQQVIFGGTGEVLTIRHDSMNRSSFESGILLTCREILHGNGFQIGMDHLLNV